MNAVVRQPARLVVASVGLLMAAMVLLMIGMLAKWNVGDVLSGVLWLVGVHLFVTALAHTSTRLSLGLKLVAWGTRLFIGGVGVMAIVAGLLNSWHDGLVASTATGMVGAGLLVAGVVWFYWPHSN